MITKCINCISSSFSPFSSIRLKWSAKLFPVRFFAAALILLVLLSLPSEKVKAQGTWTQYDTTKLGRCVYPIDSVFYVLNGREMWRYSPASKIWSRCLDYPGTLDNEGYHMTISGKAYFGTGNPQLEFWCYDPSVNTWTAKANFPGPARDAAFAIGLNGIGYVAKGYRYYSNSSSCGFFGGSSYSTGYTNYADFYQYNPQNNTWSQITSSIGTGGAYLTGFTANNKIYFGLGSRLQGYSSRSCSGNYSSSNGQASLSEWYEYDPATNVFTQKAPLITYAPDYNGYYNAFGRANAAAYSLNNIGYVFGGYYTAYGYYSYGYQNYYTYYHSSNYVYDPLANKWQQGNSSPVSGNVAYYGNLFSLGNKGYQLTNTGLLYQLNNSDLLIKVDSVRGFRYCPNDSTFRVYYSSVGNFPANNNLTVEFSKTGFSDYGSIFTIGSKTTSANTGYIDAYISAGNGYGPTEAYGSYGDRYKIRVNSESGNVLYSRGLISDTSFYLNPAPPTSFSATVTSNCINNNSFQFNNLTSGWVTSSAWSFGDGTSSTDLNPVKSYTTPGWKVVSLTTNNNYGCKSTISNVLFVRPADTTTLNINACNNYSYNDTTYSASGIYYHQFTNQSGCDSIVILNLTINQPSFSTDSVILCTNQLPYTWNGNNYSNEGTYTYSSVNAAGCDSTATLILVINDTTTSITNISVCSDQLPYSWNGSSYSTAGNYNWTGINAAGCDSVATLNLSIVSSVLNTTTVSVCDSYFWSQNGQTYTVSGTYSIVSGCHTDVLNLTVNPSTADTSNVTACDNYFWSANGQTYTSGGTYTYILDCHTAQLNLTINNSSSSTTVITICANNTPYSWNGGTYSTSGTYTYTTTNALGCDSIVTLNLTVNPNSSNPVLSVTQPTCATATGTITVNSPTGAGYSYSLNGGSYQSGNSFGGLVQGSYTIQVATSTGCVALVPASATINPQPFVPSSSTMTITGQVNVCNLIGSETTAAYTANASGATGYRWVLPANTQLVSATADSSTINIRFLNGFAQQWLKYLKVKPMSACGSGSTKLFYLGAQFPVTPSPVISSSSNVCPSLGTNVPITYTIPRVQGAASYVWAAQNGTTNILHPNGLGENDTTITVTFAGNFSSSTITVYALNSCGASGTRSLFIFRNDPSRPSLISGPTNVCANIGATGTDANYFVNAVSNVDTYTWTVPQGVTIVSGQGTNAIAVRYPQGFTSGSLSVVASNGCGISNSRSLNVTAYNAATPGQIDVINTSACPNRIYTYTIASMPANATSLVWTVPAIGTLVSGQGTTQITVSYPSTVITGYVTVQAFNNCSSSSIRRSEVKLPPCPTGFAGNPTTRSAETAEVKGMELKVFPNPTQGNFNLQVKGVGAEEVKVRILDAQGRFIKSLIIAPYQTVSLGAELKIGAYLIEVSQGKEVRTERLIRF